MKDPFSDWIDLKGLHFYSQGLEFPVAIAEHSDWDRTQLQYLNVKVHTTRSLIDWCRSHGMDWKILYPLHDHAFLHNPIKYLRYLYLKKLVG